VIVNTKVITRIMPLKVILFTFTTESMTIL